MAFEMRVLTPADQPEWRRLRLMALEQFPTAFITTAREQHARPASQDRATLSRGHSYGLIQNKRMIGIAALIPLVREACQHRMELGAVFVVADHWGTGAAQWFMDAIETEARRRNALQLELSVAADNLRAIRFYERNGFERFGIQPRAIMFNGAGQDDFFYVKMLDR